MMPLLTLIKNYTWQSFLSMLFNFVSQLENIETKRSPLQDYSYKGLPSPNQLHEF